MTKQLHSKGVRRGILAILCSSLTTLTLLAQFSVGIVGTDPSCNGYTDGSLQATAFDGWPPYVYTWSTGATGPSLFGLGAGTYSVTVVDIDGAIATASYTLIDPDPITVELNVDSICTAPGDIASSVSGGTPPYSYLWSNGDTTSNLIGVPTGFYCLTVTDANGCKNVNCVNVKDTLSVIVKTVDSQCAMLCDGAANAMIMGGTAPFSYLWNTGDTTSTISPLPPGTYTVTVTDASGCTAVGSGVVSEPPPIIIDLDITHPDCQTGLNGSISATVSGGVPGYTYLWNTQDTTATLSNITAGTYTLIVTDGNLCMVDTMITIVGSQLMLSVQKEDESCPGANDGAATASVSGGTPPYTYDWSNMQTGPTITNLAPGAYSVTVSDSTGCTATATVNIAPGIGINVSAVKTDITCNGQNDGTATASASGGSGNFVYMWDNGENTPGITGLSAGTYKVIVTDTVTGCQDSAAVTILEPSELTCSITVDQAISAPGANDGQLTANGNGGTPPYSYRWSNSSSSPTISNLGPGTYTVTVSDENDCESICELTLENPITTKGKIGDFVWEDLNENGIQDAGEPGISDLKVTLSGTDVNGNSISAIKFTDRSGMYMFGDLDAGTYKLTFDTPNNYRATNQDAGNDDGLDSDADPNNGMTINYTLMQGDTNLTIDAGFINLCINLTDAGTIGYDEYFCGPGYDPAPIVELTPPVGGQGNIEYLWMKSNTSAVFSSATFSIIPGATGPTYDPPVIYKTTWYVRCTRREFCSDFLETNVVVKEVGNETIAEINGPTTVCIDEPFTFEATDAGPGSTYIWDFGPNATPRTPRGRVVTVTYNNFGQRTINLTVIRPNCTASNILKIAISTDPDDCGNILNIRTTSMNQKEVFVEWTAGPENSNYTYQVQHSADGEDFRAIMEIDMIGNTFGTNKYEYMDKDPKPGHNFYRILQINRDNGKEYYSESSATLIQLSAEKVMIYPNPSIGFFVERLEGIDVDGFVRIYDQKGTLTEEVFVPAGEFRTFIDLSNYPSGVYTFQTFYKGEQEAGESHRVVRY